MSNKTIDWCRRFLSVSAILIIGVVIYIVFIQENSVTRIYHNQTVIDSLQMEIARCNDTLAKYKELNHRLDCGDGPIIERIVREQYDMSLPNEDVYVFE